MSDPNDPERASDDAVDEQLLSLLVCPLCREPVRQRGGRLVCSECGRRYPVRDGIPVMLVGEAAPPEESNEGQSQE